MQPASSLVERLVRGIDRRGRDPVAHQIVEYVWTEVVDGSLDPGARLPTRRELAIELGVSPRTVKWAYAELERLGVVATRPGEGTFVGLEPPTEDARRRRREFLALCGRTVEKAQDLGYDVDELIGALAEYRSAQEEATSPTGDGAQ